MTVELCPTSESHSTRSYGPPKRPMTTIPIPPVPQTAARTRTRTTTQTVARLPSSRNLPDNWISKTVCESHRTNIGFLWVWLIFVTPIKVVPRLLYSVDRIPFDFEGLLQKWLTVALSVARRYGGLLYTEPIRDSRTSFIHINAVKFLKKYNAAHPYSKVYYHENGVISDSDVLSVNIGRKVASLVFSAQTHKGRIEIDGKFFTGYVGAFPMSVCIVKAPPFR